MQRDTKNCFVDIYYKDNDFLKLTIRSGDFQEKSDHHDLVVNSPEGLNEDIFRDFSRMYQYLENKHYE